MAEEAQGAQPEEQAQGAPNGAVGAEPERDWKAEYEKLLKHSRTWEDKAKRLADKAKKLDELEAQSMTDAERASAAEKRAAEAEAKVAEYERKAERDGIVAEVAADRGVDAEWLSRLAGDTREEVEANAEWLAKKLRAASVYPSVPDNGGAKAPTGKTPDEIDKIKDPMERLRARAEYASRNRRK